MGPDVLILRPEPGASETARRARDLGLSARVASLFAVAPLEWEAPEPADFDAILFTSGHAAREGGTALGAFVHLPCYAVGEASAAAARKAGFRRVRTGPSDGEAALALMAVDGVRKLFHPCGRDFMPVGHPSIAIDRRPVYASNAIPRLPEEAADALRGHALVLLHSPRAAAIFGSLTDQAGLARHGVALAAISAAAAEAAGSGWREVSIAAQPRDEALLELAAKLCKIGGEPAMRTNR